MEEEDIACVHAKIVLPTSPSADTWTYRKWLRLRCVQTECKVPCVITVWLCLFSPKPNGTARVDVSCS